MTYSTAGFAPNGIFIHYTGTHIDCHCTDRLLTLCETEMHDSCMSYKSDWLLRHIQLRKVFIFAMWLLCAYEKLPGARTHAHYEFGILCEL